MNGGTVLIESEKRFSDKELQKAKIRERYKGIDLSILEVIPAKKRADFYDGVDRKVAVYVRVSTENLQQTSSYELQRNYYEDKVHKNQNWTLVDIYADEGISGTSLKHRDAFNRMIEDCKSGKIDMIITKSVSRFARNIVDCISIVRELGALKNPVGVFFETENIFTLHDNTEMSLSFTATMAQEESHVKSSIMNASIEMRFSHGIILTPVLLGYDHDEDGNLVINEGEARTVRLLFFMYLYGYSCQQIADTLVELGRKTKKGNTLWTASTVLNVLRNERYCGEVLTRKTFTPSYLNHKSKKNNGDRTQHRWSDHHEAIISRDDFIAIQHLIANAKYGNKGILPELKVIPDGALKGFVSINPRWSGFKVEDYITISESVYENDDNIEEDIQIKAQSGEFDFRGFEIARSQFFNTADRLCVTFSIDEIIFSTSCVRKLDNSQHIEMFIHPNKRLLVIRICKSDTKNAMRWTKINSDGNHVPRIICGAAFLKTIYKLLDWNFECKYRIRGIRKQKEDESILIFNLRETELFVPQSMLNIADNETAIKVAPILLNVGKSIIAFPSAWADDFGSNYYRHSQSQEMAEIEQAKELNVKENTMPLLDLHDLNVTSHDIVASSIQKIISDIKESSTDG